MAIKRKTIWLAMILAVTFLMAKNLHAQQYGNEWINYGQTYYKIKTGKNGIHRLAYADLQTAGFPVDANPDNIQLFHRGQEVAIYIEGDSDNSFDATDYIEFYGRRNDGEQDTELYYQPSYQPHQYYNLFSDTTAFFLTHSPGINGQRMSLFQASADGLTPEAYHMRDTLQLRTNNYSFGQYYPIGSNLDAKLTKHDRGQGWMSSVISANQVTVEAGTNFLDFRISRIVNTVPGAANPTLEVQLVGGNNRPHNVSIHVGPDTDNLRLLQSDIRFDYNEHINISSEIQWTDISGSGQLIVRVEPVGFGSSPNDVVRVGYLKLTYPEETDAQSRSELFFHINKADNGLSLLQIENVSAPSGLYDVSDYQNPVRISSQLSGSLLSAVINNGNSRRTLFFRNDTAFVTPTIEPITFQPRNFDGYNYLIISHPYLKQAVPDSYDDPVQAYIDYRESANGGGLNVLYTDVTRLFDEFSYGEYSPLAIRRYMTLAYDNGNLGYVFLIGKGRRVDVGIQRLPDPLSRSDKDLVPTMGAPGSDILFVEGLSGTPHYPAIPIGRLSVSNPQNVAYYLDKVKEKEATLKDSPWVKNLIHLSGGTSSAELARFRTFTESLERVIEADYLGGQVTFVPKQTNNAVQFVNIADNINQGVSLVHMYGHSGPAFTDIAIGNVTDDRNGYNNVGRYPVFIVNGCRGGEIFERNTFGEDWMAAQDRGAVNFIAHSDVGIPNRLERYSRLFYETMADTLWMTKPIGQIQQHVIGEYLNSSSSSNEIDIAMVEQTVLQGDPYLSIFPHDKVDYIVREEDIFLRSIDGKGITATTPFFELGVVVNNGGRTTTESLTVNVRRILEDGSTFVYETIEVPPVRYRDTLFYEVSNQGIDVFGTSTFEVTLDVEGLVDEGSELNNTASASFFFPATGTFNTSPHNFALINTDTVQLVVQSADLQLNDKTFFVEIDTVNTFDSPWKQSNTLSGRGIGLWDIDLQATNTGQDTVRYYWRSVFTEDAALDTIPYAESTFTYIRNGVRGWGQTTFDQMEFLDLTSLSKSVTEDTWVFAGTATDIEVTTYGSENINNSPQNIVCTINGQALINAAQLNGVCGANSLNAIAFNKDSGQPYVVLRTDGVLDVFDPLTCGRSPQLINHFPDNTLTDINTPEASSNFRAYMDGVDDEDYVLMFSIDSLNYDRWNDYIRDILEEIGGSVFTINSLTPGEPYIIWGRKGTPAGSATEIVADPVSGGDGNTRAAEISFSTTVNASTDRGSIESPSIGPASTWGTLSKRIMANPVEDRVRFDVIAVTIDGADTTLFTDVQPDQLDLSSIDATEYPFLRLYIDMIDTVSATAPQLQNWSVTYEGVPEGIVSLQNESSSNVQLQEGEPFNAAFRFSNISSYDFMDSLSVRYTFTNQNTRQEETDSIRIPALQAGQEADFSLPITTRGRVGLNDLEVFVNPGDEIEQYYNNNIVRLASFFEVQRDEVNPNMDITFDGVYIMDGDIVSPSPLITIELRDNNPFLFKEDTLGAEIFLGQNCEGCTAERVSLNSPQVEWFPATENSNYRIEYRPERMEDGNYKLEVEVGDASGNQSGIEPYEVNFEVINESAITHFYPYPNPFSTSTRFVFTVTGSEVPTEIKIQIFTVSGKLVREITSDELGPIRIGNNISEYAWNGRDEFGDRLAKGTYIYRVQVKASGSELGRRPTAGDKGFKNGYGKIVLIR